MTRPIGEQSGGIQIQELESCQVVLKKTMINVYLVVYL